MAVSGGLTHLRALGITRLDLRGTKVTDAGIAHLTGAKELVYLNLYGTGVTDAGAAKLAALARMMEPLCR